MIRNNGYASGYKAATPDTLDIEIKDEPYVLQGDGNGNTEGWITLPRLDYTYATLVSTEYRNDEITFNGTAMTVGGKLNISNLSSLTVHWRGGYSGAGTVRLSKS